MARHELKDEHWGSIESVFPLQRRSTRGDVWRDHRTSVNGILRVLFSGTAWRDLPDRYGPWQTVYDRFCRWRKYGTRDCVLATLRLGADRAGQPDYAQYNADFAAADALKKTGQQALGMTRGGRGSKADPMTDGGGLPVARVLTRGNRDECPVSDEFFDMAVRATGIVPTRLAADRLRQRPGGMGIKSVIQYRTEHVSDRVSVDTTAYKGRYVVERCVGRLKRMRRLATQYEKLAANYTAMLTLGTAMIYSKALT